VVVVVGTVVVVVGTVVVIGAEVVVSAGTVVEESGGAVVLAGAVVVVSGGVVVTVVGGTVVVVSGGVVVEGGRVVGGNRMSNVTGSHISAAPATGLACVLSKYRPVISVDATNTAAVRLPYIGATLPRGSRFGTRGLSGTLVLA